MTAYYNEFDYKKAAWLRELIAVGLIADGEVDERSIADVSGSDLVGFDQCHFFAGIGIWSHALRLAGWPDDRLVWTGSCPCQPYSAAGAGKGLEDERHLWPEWDRLIREQRPGVIFGEQVSSTAVVGYAKPNAGRAAGSASRAWLDLVFGDLEDARYARAAFDLPASLVGAPHIRQRLYFVAERLADSDSERDDRPGQRGASGWSEHSNGGDACRMAYSDCDAAGRISGSVSRAQAEIGDQSDADGPSDGVRARGLADADGGHASTERQQRSGQHGQQPEDGGSLPVECGARPGAPDFRWTTPDWLFCRDAKWRPVEACSFPLDSGSPSRMVQGRDPGVPVDADSSEARTLRLAGYGDGITAPLAAAFIGAYLETAA